MVVEFDHTNENLDAIVNALQPEPCDRILAVCGSGDQAFALAGYGSQVVAVDPDSDQLLYAQYRLDALLKGSVSAFLNIGSPISNNPDDVTNETPEEQIKRLLAPNRILPNISNIKLKKNDFISELMESQILFNKLYASNLLGFYMHESFKKPSLEQKRAWFRNILKRLPESGIIYFTGPNGLGIDDNDLEGGLMREICDDGTYALKLDYELTGIARKYEKEWIPGVYVKQPK